MYQLVTTVREHGDAYEVHAILSELLPGGGVAPVASRRTAFAAGPERSLPDPFVGILQTLAQFAEVELEKSVPITHSEALF